MLFLAFYSQQHEFHVENACVTHKKLNEFDNWITNL